MRVNDADVRDVLRRFRRNSVADQARAIAVELVKVSAENVELRDQLTRAHQALLTPRS